MPDAAPHVTLGKSEISLVPQGQSVVVSNYPRVCRRVEGCQSSEWSWLRCEPVPLINGVTQRRSGVVTLLHWVPPAQEESDLHLFSPTWFGGPHRSESRGILEWKGRRRS